MTIQIDAANRIILDGKQTGLALVQRASGTVIYTPENKICGAAYREHPMPKNRYSTAHDTPASGVAGKTVLEEQLRELIHRLTINESNL